METKFLVISKDGTHEYTIVVDILTKYRTRYSLYTSNNNMWSDEYQGVMVMSLTDNGDSLKFDKPYQTLEYHEALYMNLLLNFEDKGSFETFKIIEEKVAD